MTNLLVSICCITYNHELYIRECLDGFLMQKTSFDFEILIHDDASTDKTADIIREYENRYPGIIKPIYQTENQYSRGVRPMNKLNFKRAQGKYIAMCEGDDYWIDPLKLQKQVDFLERNEEYSVCVSGYKKYNEYSKKTESIIDSLSGKKTTSEGFSFTIEDSRNRWLTKTLTALFRNDDQIIQQLTEYKYSCDVHLFYHSLKAGKGFYFTKEMGVYRIHLGGIVSMKSTAIHYKNGYLIYKELYNKNLDEYLRKEYLRSILSLLNIKFYSSSKEFIDIKYKVLFKELRSTTKKISDISLYLRNIFPYRMKNYIQKKFF